MYSRRLYSRRSLHLRRRGAYGIVGALPLGTRGCVAVAQGAKAVVWRLLKMKGRQYDKTHLVSWWVGRYSRRGLPLRGRGAYGPVLTHGPRVVATDAAGAEALVGVLKIIKDASYNKTREPPWRAMEKRHPLWWLAPPSLPKGKHVTGFSGRSRSPTNPVRWSDSSSFATPQAGHNKIRGNPTSPSYLRYT